MNVHIQTLPSNIEAESTGRKSIIYDGRSMTFSQALAKYGPDTIAISHALGIPEHEADRLINRRMLTRYYGRKRNARLRAELREIREKCAA